MHIIAKWLLIALAFLAAAYFVPGIYVSSIQAALIIAAVWGLISVTLKPILLVLTLPINILTLGLFTFFLNGFLLWLVGLISPTHFSVEGFWPAILGALIITAITWLGEKILVPKPKL